MKIFWAYLILSFFNLLIKVKKKIVQTHRYYTQTTRICKGITNLQLVFLYLTSGRCNLQKSFKIDSLHPHFEFFLMISAATNKIEKNKFDIHNPLANPRRLSIITMCLNKINFLTFISKLKNLKCNMLWRFSIKFKISFWYVLVTYKWMIWEKNLPPP